MSPRSVAARIDALRQVVTATREYLPDSALGPAESLIGRTGQRLAMSLEHTVVALAGSTGTGKSSIFNGLSGRALSRIGVRRPTTGEAHACVWGTEGADELLDWLGVGPRSSVPGGSDPDLSGLVLLDLPDFDSVQLEHRVEADRLLSVVDLIVWVLNPQKYADKVVHKSYLAQFHRHRDITVVVLNQADLLSAADLQECVTDLRHLLEDDGLAGVPLLTASTVGPPGLAGLETVLAKAVAQRQAAVRRLSADLDVVTTDLEPLVGPAVPMDGLDRAVRSSLVDALSYAAGVPLVATATERAYVHRARKHTGWPPLRWVRRMRPDPLSRLHLGEPVTSRPSATSIGPAAPAAQAAVSLALRDVANRAGGPLPAAWRTSMLAAVRSRQDDLPDALDRAVAQTEIGLDRRRLWWRAVGTLQWLFVAMALAGLLWLGVRYALFALALPEPELPQVGRLPLPTALLGGGLLAGLVLSLLVRPVVRLAARHRRRRVRARLRSGVERVADDLVLAPAQQVLDAHTRAHDYLRQARG